MSQENVEIVKRAADAFNERDVETFIALTTPDFEWTTSMAAVEGEVFVGRKGIETYFGRMGESWDEFLLVSGEFRDLGDRVLWHGDLEGRGRASGVPVTAPLDFLCDVRDGKVWRLRSFLDQGEALRAAGLKEQTMSQENVELVREVWAAYENVGIEATSGYYAHDAVVDDFPDLPDERTYVGFDGARERYWHFVRAWSDFSIEPVDFIDGGGDSVVVATAMVGCAPGSGLPLDAPAVFVWEVRDRKIVRDRAFTSKQAALKAVGLAD